MTLNSLQIVRLTSDTEIKEFKSADDDLNAFLYDDAKKYDAEFLAVTYLLMDVDKNKIVAYYSLLNDKILFEYAQRSIWNKLSRRISNAKRKKSYPSVKLGRLAISEEYAGQGVGAMILSTLKYQFTHGNRTGCRFISVDAYANAVGFYEKNGFQYLTESDAGDHTRQMFYDLKLFAGKE